LFSPKLCRLSLARLPFLRRRIDARTPAADFNLNRTDPVWFPRVCGNKFYDDEIPGQKMLSAKHCGTAAKERRARELETSVRAAVPPRAFCPASQMKSSKVLHPLAGYGGLEQGGKGPDRHHPEIGPGRHLGFPDHGDPDGGAGHHRRDRAGVTLGSLIFMHRMAHMVAVKAHKAILDDDQVDSGESDRINNGRDPDFIVYRISGPFFFDAASTVAAALDHIGRRPKAFVLDLTRVPPADGAAANALRGFIERERRHGVRVAIRGASRDVRRTLLVHGVNSRVVHFSVDEDDAREYFRLHPEAGVVSAALYLDPFARRG
jgi:anti-anti-sigma regulatory factor